MQGDDYLYPEELAKRWRMKAKTLERWRSEGRGPDFVKLGGAVRYHRRDVEAYEASRLRRVAERRP